MLFNGILGALGLAMIVPMFVPSRWRARRIATTDDSVTADAELNAPELEDQPTTQLTPIRATSLVPLTPSPWHEASDPVNPGPPGS
jgi:hypothetical protein